VSCGRESKIQLSFWLARIPLSHRGYAQGRIRVSYEDYPSMVQLFVVVRSYIGGHWKVYPRLCVGAFQVDFRLVILPIHSDWTVDCTRPRANYELVTLVATIFRVSHKVTVKGSLIVPGTDVVQTHSGSLEGKSTITAWNLAPRCKSVKRVANVTDPPALSLPLPILILQRWISSPTSGFIVGRFV
jgi:hypothetical protein